MAFLLRKAAGNELSLPKREVMWTATGKATGAELPKPSVAHISPPCAMDAGYGAIGFNVFTDGFQSFFGLFPFYSSVPPF